MKTVIVELRGKKAAALSDNGSVTIVPNRGYAVGQLVDLAARRRIRTIRRIACAVAAAAALSTAAYAIPYSSVSVDAEASFSYPINIFDRVISVKAGEGVSEELASAVRSRARGRRIGDAVAATIGAMRETDGIPEDGVVVVSVSGDTEREGRLAESLRSDVEALGGSSPLDVEAVAVSGEVAVEAKKNGVTPGKQFMVDRLAEAVGQEPGFNKDEWLERPAGEAAKAGRRARGQGAGNTDAAEASSGENGQSQAAEPSAPGKRDEESKAAVQEPPAGDKSAGGAAKAQEPSGGTDTPGGTEAPAEETKPAQMQGPGGTQAPGGDKSQPAVPPQQEQTRAGQSPVKDKAAA